MVGYDNWSWIVGTWEVHYACCSLLFGVRENYHELKAKGQNSYTS